MTPHNSHVAARFNRHCSLRVRWTRAYSLAVVGTVVLSALAALVMVTPKVVAADFSPMQPFFDNTLICQDHGTKAVCHVWFNSDGSYYVFYDLGPQSKPAAIDGPFQFEGREGTYSLEVQGAGVKVCLRPTTPVVTLAAQRAHEFLSEAKCYPLALHPVGARWQQADRHGREYTFWLLAGR